MDLFKSALQAIGDKLQDLGSLEVTTFSGRVELKSDQATPASFDDVMNRAKADADFSVKVLASTKAEMDGDICVFYDTDISDEEKLAHAELVDVATATRAASINFVKDMVAGLT